jgi:N-formylglutamate deformylase
MTMPEQPFTLSLGPSAVVLDSPHSGTDYPSDFGHACDWPALRRAEDTHVDRLYDFAPAIGVSLLCARFPRSYLDANRALDEIDLELINGAWPLETSPSAKVRIGKGLIWRLTDNGEAIYRRKLHPDEVLRRIEQCWRPYHAALAATIDEVHRRHGHCIHINCHSMPSVAGSHGSAKEGTVYPDFVVGDRDGTTASPQLTAWVAGFLRERGYDVAINDPYKGVELVRRYSNPAEGRHSIQLEINRKLYMDEASFELHDGSAALKTVLKELVVQLQAFAVPE